jgi:N-acetylmuramoyl-L-alanine amidase
MEKKINKIVALLLLCATLLLGDTALYKKVEGLYNKIPYASKSQTKQILHDLENFYINAVVQNDKKSIVQTLKGIVKCQKLLGLNSSTYEKELFTLTGKKSKELFSGTKPPSPKSSKLLFDNAPGIRSVQVHQNTLIIKFSQPIQTDDILSFHIKQKDSFKEIFDIRANMNFQAPPLVFTNIKKAKIAQNRRNKVRVVLENDSKIYARAFIRKGTLFIQVDNKPAAHKQKKEKPLFKPIKKKPKLETPAQVPLPKIALPSSHKAIYAGSKTIVIDAGHGGKDSGAVGYKKYQEKRAVLKVAKLLKKLLKKQGYKVYLTREDDHFLKLSERTHFANRKKADLFISIHANAAPSAQKLSLKGIETFFLSPAKTEKAKRIAAKENASAMNLDRISKDTLLSFLNRTKIVQSNKLAIDIQSGILSSIRSKYDKIVDGGVREAPFWVLVGAQMPAVLVEIGYITNPLEGERLFNPFYQKALAKGILNGINNYFAKNF